MIDIFNESIFLLSPLLVPITEELEDETEEMLEKKHEKLSLLPEADRFRLACQDTIQQIVHIGKRYHLDQFKLSHIARIVREFYFHEISYNDIQGEIKKRIGVNTVIANEITQILKSQIFDKNPYEEMLRKFILMPIEEAIKKYPTVANQQITQTKIKIEKQQGEHFPSIENWILDYTNTLGYRKHSSIERSEYLFRGENGVYLFPEERDTLDYILRSFDEKIPVPIDPETLTVDTDFLNYVKENDKLSSFNQKPKPADSSSPGAIKTMSNTLDLNERPDFFKKPGPNITPNVSPDLLKEDGVNNNQSYFLTTSDKNIKNIKYIEHQNSPVSNYNEYTKADRSFPPTEKKYRNSKKESTLNITQDNLNIQENTENNSIIKGNLVDLSKIKE